MTGGSVWPFVGRAQELQHVRERLLGATPAGGLILSGPEGVGKSRLLRAAGEELRQQGLSAVEAYGTTATAAIHLGAFVHLLPPEEVARADPQRLLAQAFALLRRTAEGRPVLLLVDDLHMMDPLGAAFLHFAVRGQGATLLATCLEAEPLPDPLMQLVRADLLESMPVGPLSRAAVAELRCRLRAPVDRFSVDRLHEVAGGNALVLRELIEEEIADQAFVPRRRLLVWRSSQKPLAFDAAQAMARRVVELPADLRSLLEITALAQPLGRSMAERLTGSAAVEELRSTGLLLEGWDGRRRTLRVDHPLRSEAVIRSLPQARMRDHLRRLADAILAHGARRREDIVRLGAWHVDHGTPVPGAVLVRAAALCYAGGDLGRTINLAQAALQHDAGFPAVELLASALGFDGEPGQALTVLRAARPAADDPGLLSRWHMLEALIRYNMLHDASVIGELRAAASTLPTEDGDLLLSLAACLEAGTGNIGDAYPRLTDLARRGTGPAQLHSEAMLLGLAAETADTSVRLAPERIQERFVSHYADWPTLSATAGYARWITAYTTADLASFLSDLDIELLDFLPIVDLQWLLGHSIASRLRGRALRARQAAEAAYALARRGGQIFLTAALSQTAQAAALAGDAATALAALERAGRVRRRTMALQDPLVALAGITVAICAHEPDAAEERARRSAEQFRGDRLAGFEVHALQSLALLGRVTPPDADRLHALSAADASNLFTRAAAAHATALTTGDPEALGTVEELYTAAGLRWFAGCAALQRVEGLLERRQFGSAAAAARAHEVIRGTDTVFPSEGLTSRLARLTAREQEIARLAAERCSSALIASRIVIERRSVESHLFRIYRKLGIRDRADLHGVIALLEELARRRDRTP